MAVSAGDDGVSLAERYKAKPFGYFQGLPPVEYLLDGIIAKRTQFFIYGKPKVGKTFFALSLALTAACCHFSKEFCGLKVEGQRVLYIIAEGSESEYAARIKAWIRAEVKRLVPRPDKKARAEMRAMLEEQIASFFHTVSVAVPINQPEHVKALLEANPGCSALAPGWDWVIIDTMFRNMSGDVIKPQDSAAFGAGVDYIREATGATVLVLAHEAKDLRARGGGHPMHNPAKAYCEDSTFATEKVIATANAVMIALLLILGQLELKSGTSEPEEYASAVESGQ